MRPGNEATPYRKQRFRHACIICWGGAWNKIASYPGPRWAGTRLTCLWHYSAVLHTFRFARLLSLAFAATVCSCNLWYLSISRCICRQDHGRGGQAAGEGGKHILFRRRSQNKISMRTTTERYKIIQIPWH